MLEHDGLLTQLSNNVGLVALLALICSLIPFSFRKNHELVTRTSLGLIFGGVSVLCMLFPVSVAEGVIIDGKTIIVPLSGYFYGPIAGIITALITSLMRLSIGGVGTTAGVVVISTGAAIGIFFYEVYNRKHHDRNGFILALFGIVVAVNALLTTFVLPFDLALKVIQKLWFPVLIVYPIGVVVAGSLLGVIESRNQAIGDLSENKKELIERNQFIESIVNLTPDVLYIYDLLEKKNIYVNQGIQKILGYSIEDLKTMGNQLIYLLMHPDDLKQYLEITFTRYNTLKDQESLIHSYRMKSKSGEWRWLSSNEIIYARQDDGSPKQILGLINDITESKLSEEALRESEANLKKAQKIAKIGSWAYSMSGELSWSNECYIIFGKSPESFVLNGETFFNTIHPDDRSAMQEWIRACTEGEKPGELMFRIILGDGSIRGISGHGELVYNADGKPTLMAGTAQDITERKIAEEKMRNSLKEKEALLQELFHRTKNNMNVISALLELQSNASGDENVQRIIRESQFRIRTMALAHEKLYQSKSLSSINMKEYIVELSRLLKESYDGSKKKISIAFDIEEIELLIDMAVPCGLIINELLSNSLKYAFPGVREGQITISFHKSKAHELELLVGDNGVGLPKPFDVTKSEKLGLQLVIRTVKHQLKGSVYAENEGGLKWYIHFSDELYSERV